MKAVCHLGTEIKVPSFSPLLPFFLHWTGVKDTHMEAVYHIPRWAGTRFILPQYNRLQTMGEQANSWAIEQEVWEALKKSGLNREPEMTVASSSYKAA